MEIYDTVAAMQRVALEWRASGERVVFVPTMGALHVGHGALLAAARTLGTKVVLSIFVNPTQFGPKEDFASYPRTWAADIEMAQACGVDAIFAPTVAAMYPVNFQTFVEPGAIASGLCGAARPGHFRGVATVVLKLLQAVQPHVALFGEKDYQQLQVIRRMVTDLSLPVEIIGVPTVREADGVALSSRNQYLSPAERQLARIIPDTLLPLVQQKLSQQATAPIIENIRAAFTTAGITQIDYVAIVDAEQLTPLEQIDRPARLCIAVRIGTTRLIDNVGIG